jgi:23S rRNA pseudouridine2605 synthase
MNNKEGNKRGGARPNSSRPNFSKPTRGGAERSGAKPAMQKRAQGPKKVKTTTKSAPVATDKVKKNQIKPLKRPKVADEIRLNKYIANSGICSRRDADIYIQSGNVKVNGSSCYRNGIYGKTRRCGEL